MSSVLEKIDLPDQRCVIRTLIASVLFDCGCPSLVRRQALGKTVFNSGKMFSRLGELWEKLPANSVKA